MHDVDLIGPRGVAFDNDDLPADDSEDEDIKADPVSQMDMKVCKIQSCSSRSQLFLLGAAATRLFVREKND